jgi:glycosyltransferase involved in cell wall biosynthesis
MGSAVEAPPAERSPGAIRALFVFPTGHRLGGGEQQLSTLLQTLDGRRVEPMVAFLADGPFLREVAAYGVETALVPAGRLRQARRLVGAVRSLAALMHKERPDVVVTWGAKAQLYGGVAAKLVRRPPPVLFSQLEYPTSWIHRVATLIPSAAVVCSSESVMRAQRAIRPVRRTFVVNICLGEVPAMGDRRELREALGIAPSDFVVGMVGRLQAWKRHDAVLRAIALLRQGGHDVHGLMVGGDAYGLDPEYPPKLERLAAELGIARSVTFTGQVPMATEYLPAMDVLVNASEPEPFGLSILEAMAAGVPVVAVDSGGPREIIRRGQDGLLVPSSDPAQIAAAVERLLTSPELRERVREAGARRVRESFTADRMAAELSTRLEEIVAPWHGGRSSGG